MFRTFAVLLLMLPMVITVVGRDRRKAAVLPDDVAEVVEQVNSVASEIKTMNCVFVQTKQMSMLNEVMKSRGEMWFESPSKLRWEYTDPYSYMFIFNGDKVKIGNDSKHSVLDAGKNRIFGEIARLIINTVTGHIVDSCRDFDMTVARGVDSVNIKLTPLKRELRQLMTSVELTFTTPGYCIKEVKLREPNGDSTVIEISNVKLNIQPDESLFTID